VLGLELQSFYQHATECIDAVVYFIDDWAYLANNFTYRDVWYGPIVNFTGIISGNLSDASSNCYDFGISVYTVTKTSWSQFTSVSDFMLAFLFNLMGNALAFSHIFDEIESDMKQQYYPDIAF
jgi:hypothetical protein